MGIDSIHLIKLEKSTQRSDVIFRLLIGEIS